MADNDVTRIAGNIGAMNALYSLTNINKQLSIHQTRLATGKRINSAADDPAGLAISTKMLARSEGLKTALSNIGDAKNLLAVAESGLGRLNDILSSMRTITENAANDTNGTEERDIVKEQLASYAAQINDIVEQTKWSDKKLIGGDYNLSTNALTFQTGVDAGETTKLSGLADMHSLALALLKDTTAVVANVKTAAIGTSMTAGTSAVTEGNTELASGSYRVETTMSTAGVYTATLLNGTNGSVVMGSAAEQTYSTASGATNVINFGNGLSITLATSVYTAEVVATNSQTVGTNITAITVSGATVQTAVYDLKISIDSDGTSGTIIFGTGDSAITKLFTYASSTAQDVALSNGVTISVAAGIAASDSKTGTFTNVNHVDEIFTLGNSTTAVDYTKSTAAETGVVNIGQSTVNGTVAGTLSKSSLSADFSDYMGKIDAAMKVVNSQLSKIGSLTGSLTFKEDQVSSSQINVEASYNRIMNANMAEEQVNASKLLILQQTSTAMLAQANAAPQFLLSLFK